MPMIKFQCGDILVMKKKHPCSEDKFTVLRTGSDVRIVCNRCGRDITMARDILEKSIKTIISKSENA